MRVLIALLLVAVVAAAPQFANTRGWTSVGPSDPKDGVSLVFGIKQKNVDLLQKIVDEVSNPDSPKYGKHLSREEVNSITENIEATDAIENILLNAQAITVEISRNGDFIQAVLPASVANDMFSAEFHEFEHSDFKYNIHRTSSYSVPSNMEEHLDFVVGLIDFPGRRPKITPHEIPTDLPKVNGFPKGYVTASLLLSYYNISNPIVATQSSTQCVFETLGQSYDPSDLSSFQSAMNVQVNPVAKVIGPNTPSDCASNPNNCVEASLDIEYIMAIAQGAPSTFWSFSESDQHPYLSYVIAIGAADNPPLVHSMSYGDVEPQYIPSVMQSYNTQMMKLGARGISMMVSSGDDGVANFPARNGPSGCGFNPSFPAAVPYVTAVGATQGPEEGKPEVACTSDTGGQITTGGGFSTIFSSPSYQTSEVADYFSINADRLPPTNMWNKQGRGYPDVATLGHNYIIADGGSFTAGSGTSASSPVFAGMITLINGLRIQQGKSALGFLNPVLYKLAASNPEIFNDITVGENNCAAGNTNPTCCSYGFYASRGWDPLTGLGSPNFARLSEALMN